MEFEPAGRSPRDFVDFMHSVYSLETFTSIVDKGEGLKNDDLRVGVYKMCKWMNNETIFVGGFFFDKFEKMK